LATLYSENREAETIARALQPERSELTGVFTIPILHHFPAQWRVGAADIAVTRRVTMMRDPGNLRRYWGQVRRPGPAAFGRRR